MCLLVLPLGGAISHYICSAQVPFSSQSHSCPDKHSLFRCQSASSLWPPLGKWDTAAQGFVFGGVFKTWGNNIQRWLQTPKHPNSRQFLRYLYISKLSKISWAATAQNNWLMSCWFISSNTLKCRKMKGHPTVWSRSHLHLYYSTGWVNADSVCQSESVSWCGWTLHRLSNTPKLVVTQDKENVCKNLPDGGFICLFLKIKSKTGRGKKNKSTRKSKQKKYR